MPHDVKSLSFLRESSYQVPRRRIISQVLRLKTPPSPVPLCLGMPAFSLLFRSADPKLLSSSEVFSGPKCLARHLRIRVCRECHSAHEATNPIVASVSGPVTAQYSQ